MSLINGIFYFAWDPITYKKERFIKTKSYLWLPIGGRVLVKHILEMKEAGILMHFSFHRGTA